MATYQEGNQVTYPSGYDFTVGGTVNTCPYLIVKLNGSLQVVPATAATDQLIGVLRNTPTQTGSAAVANYPQNADVHIRNAAGQFKVQAGGSFSAGAYLTANSSGQAVATTTSGDQIIGIAEQASTGAGQIITYRCASFIHP